MDMLARINALSDYDAVQVLNRAVSGFAPNHPQLPQLQYLSDVWRNIASQTATEIVPRKDDELGTPAQQAAAARLVLIEWVDDAGLAKRVGAAIDADRNVLADPITVALIMAGIVIALQTRVGLKVNRKDGKVDVELAVEKKPTADSIIGKFFSFFK